MPEESSVQQQGGEWVAPFAPTGHGAVPVGPGRPSIVASGSRGRSSSTRPRTPGTSAGYPARPSRSRSDSSWPSTRGDCEPRMNTEAHGWKWDRKERSATRCEPKLARFTSASECSPSEKTRASSCVHRVKFAVMCPSAVPICSTPAAGRGTDRPSPSRSVCIRVHPWPIPRFVRQTRRTAGRRFSARCGWSDVFYDPERSRMYGSRETGRNIEIEDLASRRLL